jgi:enoyl-CoA hydratase/carnithine racemase
VLPTALERARDIALNTAPVSVAISKRLLWEGLNTPIPEMRKREDAMLAWTGNQADAREGVESFLQKRPPEWKLSVARDKPDLLEPGA